jgi:hypothetical protein
MSVAAGGGGDNRGFTERLPQPRHVNAHHLDGLARSVVSHSASANRLAADRLVGVQQQDC